MAATYRDEPDDQSTDSSHRHAGCGLPGMQSERFRPDSTCEHELGGQETLSSPVNRRDHKDRRGNKLDLERLFDVRFLLDRFDVRGDETANQANEDTDRTNDDGEDHGIPSAAFDCADAAADDQRRTGRLGETSEQVGTHTGDVADIVTDVVGDSLCAYKTSEESAC